MLVFSDLDGRFLIPSLSLIYSCDLLGHKAVSSNCIEVKCRIRIKEGKEQKAKFIRNVKDSAGDRTLNLADLTILFSHGFKIK